MSHIFEIIRPDMVLNQVDGFRTCQNDLKHLPFRSLNCVLDPGSYFSRLPVSITTKQSFLLCLISDFVQLLPCRAFIHLNSPAHIAKNHIFTNSSGQSLRLRKEIEHVIQNLLTPGHRI